MPPSSTRRIVAAALPAFFGEYPSLIHLFGLGVSFHSSVEAEVSHINKQQVHGKARRIIESTQDTGDVIKRYRAIESLVRQLQVSTRPAFYNWGKIDRGVERRCASNLGQHEEIRPGMQTMLGGFVNLMSTYDR